MVLVAAEASRRAFHLVAGVSWGLAATADSARTVGSSDSGSADPIDSNPEVVEVLGLATDSVALVADTAV